MKKCPQCNSVFADDTRYCLNDGTLLIEENLPLPTTAAFGNEETAGRSAPIIVDIAPPNMPPLPIQNPSAQETIILHTPPQQTTKSPKYAVFLVLGLLIGGVLVFGAFLLAGQFYQNADSSNNAENKSSKKKADSAGTTKSEADSGEYNGRVIATNANLRSEPGLYAEEIGVLPIQERIKIVRREHNNSPWYYVEAENGGSGWIHGNTIEFTK